MEALLTVDNLISLFTLATLEIILGIDNVIFVSIIMGRLPREKQLAARRAWMFGGIAMRIILLFCLSWLVAQKGQSILTVFGKSFDLASLVMIGGGLFLLYKTVKEIHHKLEGDEEELEQENTVKRNTSFGAAVAQIILVDMVFSFDSMITAVGVAKSLPVMITAVSIAMVVMFFFSQKISDFIHKHPTLKLLALSFLVLVSVVLLMEGFNAEAAHEMHLKNYVYFAMAFSFGVELMNMHMFKKKKARKKAKPVELHEPLAVKGGEAMQYEKSVIVRFGRDGNTAFRNPEEK